MRANFLLLFTVAASLAFSGCNDDETVTPPAVGNITLKIEHQVNGQPLVYNTQNYTTPGGEIYTVNDFKYYLSNISFQHTDRIYAEPESYRLINHATSATRTFTLQNVPAGTYSKLVFAIGVDSTRNHTGAQTGALDPANGMLWDWNIGYKFLQLEGNSPSSPQPANIIQYHVGRDSNYRIMQFTLPSNIEVSTGSYHTINITADVNRMFGTTADPFLFSQTPVVMGIGNSERLANNYSQMFTVTSVTND